MLFNKKRKEKRKSDKKSRTNVGPTKALQWVILHKDVAYGEKIDSEKAAGGVQSKKISIQNTSLPSLFGIIFT